MSCNVSYDELHCLNGGSCRRLDEDVYVCSCASGWSGENCQLRSIDSSLWAIDRSSSVRANILAGFSAGLLLLIVSGFILIVYLRYHKKQRLSADRLFKATAEELYRRPFNGRSSVVESLSRISSLRRTAANEEKEQEQVITDNTEISVKAECVQNADSRSHVSDMEALEIIESDSISK